MRLDLIRQQMVADHGERYAHLKFITCTWPSDWTDDPVPDLAEFKIRWRDQRSLLTNAIGAVAGTDVVEVVTKQREDGKFRHHIHTHGLWCAPFVKMDEFRSAVSDAGIGRTEYTVLRERSWEDHGGEVRVKPAIWCAIDYLAKYLTKAQGAKRMVWGELRSWKKYLPQKICRSCVKTTRQAKDYEDCNCEPQT